MVYVDNSAITPLYANTSPDTIADAAVVDPAIAALVTAINTNADIYTAFITALELPIPDQSIVTRHLRNLAVTSPKLAALAVTADKIADGSITLAKLQDLVVTAAKIANGTITEPKYATGSVSSRAIGAGEVKAGNLDPALLTEYGTVATNAKFELIDKQLADTAVYARAFGVHVAEEPGFENYDNHDALLAAVSYATQLGKSADIQLPSGTILTSPISFQGYNEFRLIGSVARKFGGTKNPTLIKFIASGDVGLQFSDTVTPTPAWMCKGVSLVGINIDGNNLVQNGVNGNFNFAMKDVNVQNCLANGIVIEDLGYPIHFDSVLSTFNSGNGITIKGPRTTKIDFYRCEFMSNGGWGIVLEGAASGHFLDCNVQSNAVGGLKIYHRTYSGYVGQQYLQDIIFTNFYTEQNGTLDPSNPLYEGNWAVWIGSQFATDGNTNLPRNIRFFGGLVNQSTNGKTLKLDAVTSCYIDFRIPTAPGKVIEIDQTGRVNGVEFSTLAKEFQILSGMSTDYSLTSYYTSKPAGIAYNGGLFPSRGRTEILYFYVSTTAAFSSYQAITAQTFPDAMMSTFRKGYPAFKSGFIYGISVEKVSNTGSSGTIKVTPTMSTTGIGTTMTKIPVSGSGEDPTLSLNLVTSPKGRKTYTIGMFPYPDRCKLGVLLETDAYTVGTDDGYIIGLMIEY